jgi:hypothetical protein
MSTNSATFTGRKKQLLREKVLRRGRDKRPETVFQVTFASNVISSESFVRVEEAALILDGVHSENGKRKRTSE